MIANYGFKDGSGEYYITIDTDRCTGCGDCVPVCPGSILEVMEDEFDPLSDDIVLQVKANERKKINYSCSQCKPSSDRPPLPCVQACTEDAISHSW